MFSTSAPWLIEGQQYGWVDQTFAAQLRQFPDVFHLDEQAVCLAAPLVGYQERTQAVHGVMHQLHAAGVIDTWVGEAYPVTLAFDATPVLEMERAAASFMGIRSFGVHVNGLVRKADGIHVWIGVRSAHKPFWPGKLDQMVAGGQPIGLGLLENVIKEAQEEASVSRALAEQAQAVGQLAYRHQGVRGLEDSTLYLYDLWLPEDFQPVNEDGEVEAFRLIPLQELAELTEHTAAFKDNCNLVNIDLLLRQQLFNNSHTDYSAIRQALYGA
ncbi:MAG: DUF4743 domain-containing protein [Thiolinea sp.]